MINRRDFLQTAIAAAVAAHTRPLAAAATQRTVAAGANERIRVGLIGFNSALPCLLAIVSVKTGKTVKWDGKEARTT